MDDEAKFGPVFTGCPSGDAIRRDLLSDYQVVIVGVGGIPTYAMGGERGTGHPRWQRSTTPTLAGRSAYPRRCAKYDLRRVISFHSG